MNSLSKWEARNYPTLLDNWIRLGRVAECECLTFAALMAYYGPNSGFQPDDTPEHIAYIRSNWNPDNLYSTVYKIVNESGIFTANFSEISGFESVVTMYLESIEQQGMAATLKRFLG